MSLTQLCRETAKKPSKALFYFQVENITGITPMRIITEKDCIYTDRMLVQVNWAGKLVQAEKLALDGKYWIVLLEILATFATSLGSCQETLPPQFSPLPEFHRSILSDLFNDKITENDNIDINGKLDRILHNHQVLFSLMSKVLGSFQGSRELGRESSKIRLPCRE